MDKTQIRKLANIARAAGVSWVYYSHLEEALLHDQPLDCEALAQGIYVNAMAKRRDSLCKRRDVIVQNIYAPVASQMCQARYFARVTSVLDDYGQYIEGCLSDKRPFDMEQCVEAIFNAAMTKYEWHLIHKISVNTGINVGGEDAV